MSFPISFFIPAFNCAATLKEAVDSILLTNFTDGDELIIVNDCSNDETKEVLDFLQKEHPFLIVINHIRNKGGGAARNTAIENAKNELLFCLDSDNILAPNSIKSLKDYLIKENAAVAVFQEMHYFSISINEIEKVWTLPSGEFKKNQALLQSYTPGSGGNYLFTKKSWVKAGGYPEFAGALDTWGFGLRQQLTGAKMVVLEKSFYYHRLLDDSYYLRDAWNRRKSVTLRALQILIPFFDLLHDEDINYIMSEKYRYIWFERLKDRPITIVEKKNKNLIWSSQDEEKITFYKKLKYQLRNLIH